MEKKLITILRPKWLLFWIYVIRYSRCSKISNTSLQKKGLDKQPRPRSDFFWSRSTLFDILTSILRISALIISFYLRTESKMSCDMRFPKMWYVLPAKAQTRLRIRTVWLLSKCHIVGNHMSWLKYVRNFRIYTVCPKIGLISLWHLFTSICIFVEIFRGIL